MRLTGQSGSIVQAGPVAGFVSRVLLPATCLALAMLLLSVLVGRGVAKDQELANLLQSRIQAVKFVSQIIDGEPVSCMYGNVFIDRDTITARSDTAYFFQNRNLFELVNQVRITRNDALLTCDHGIYDRTLDRGEFSGHVNISEGEVTGSAEYGEIHSAWRFLTLIKQAVVVTPDYTVSADTIAQDRQSGDAEAFGSVTITDPDSDNVVTGSHALFYGHGEMAEVDLDPVLVSPSQSGETVRSRARLMRFYRQQDLVVMVDSVRIRQGTTLAVADTAMAYGQDRLVLTGSPVLTMGTTDSMTGERMEFAYRNGELRQLIITGSGRLENTAPDSLAQLYAGLPDLDVLEGDSVTVDFENRKIRRTVVVGHAHSRYTPVDMADEIATNDVTGDTITLFFSDNQVARVQVQGNADGTYRFARLAEMRAQQGERRRRASGGGASVTDSLVVAVADTGGIGLDFGKTAQEATYGGQLVTFLMSDRTMDIQNEGRLDYDTMHLTAGHIKLDTDHRELYATDEPTVKDGDTITGQRMGYNFEHRSASVENGATAFDSYYYVGHEIKRFGDQTMKISGGEMTSCDLAEPHYNFWSGKMKMRPGDKVVAAPIILKVGHVPVFALPFYYKNLKSGRQSGILFPSFDFGWSSREGRYIRDFGYYWATNDFMDFVVEGDYNENRDFGYRVSNRYVKRYGFNGGVDYSRKVGLGGDKSREWQLRWNHNQPKLWDDYQFRADVRMASNTLTSNDFSGSAGRDIVSGQLRSNVFLSRSWRVANATLNANRDERVNASDSDAATDNLVYSMTAPSLTLNFKRIPLAPALRKGQHGNPLLNVLRSTYFQQRYTFTAKRTGYENHIETGYAAAGNWSLSYHPDRVGIFNVSVSANARQNWRRDTSLGQVWEPDTNFVDGGFYTDFDQTSEETNPSLNFATGVGTALYGLFPVKVGRLRAMRHTMRVNTSWTLRPGLGSKQSYGTSMSLGFDNRLDLKYLSADSDSTFVEKKLDGAIDWSLNTSYNPQIISGSKWGDIGSALTVKPGQSRYLKLKVSNTIDPVTIALKRTAFTYGLSFRGRLDVGVVAEVDAGQRSSAIERLADLAAEGAADTSTTGVRPVEGGPDNQEDGEFLAPEEDPFSDFYNRAGRRGNASSTDLTEGGRYIPFDANASFSYAYTNATRSKRATTNIRLNAQLTPNWGFRYSASFDLDTGIPVRQQYSLNRDLHCWRFEFNRTISAVDSQFGFRLYLKAIPALKIARGREDYMSGPGGGIGGGIF